MLDAMPEGHTIHRAARLQGRALAGRRVAVASPQGRFAEGAAVLDGRRLERIDAVGKHLLYRFEGAPALHVHLGLFGRFLLHEGEAPRTASPQTRLALAADAEGEGQARRPAVTLRCSGPTACELLPELEEAALRARLGPDPLDPTAGPEGFAAALARRRAGIGQALLDQRAVAGVGNVYRAEALFLTGLHPDQPAPTLRDDDVEALWATLRELLRAGERQGRIVTIAAADRTRPPSRLRRDEALYVYRREGLPCRRCGTVVRAWPLGGRRIFACPGCQPPRPTG